mmetsp:Transcript_38600/g.96340  ORF Transcript_38600/g.96340 Transcript_38600/m.96340 type:complete len:260 (-) Transcript_38600:423-1202(-)
MLFLAITCALLYSWLTANPHDVELLLLAFAPVFHVMICSPKVILPQMVLTTSIELFKQAGEVNATLLEMKTERTIKLLKLLSTLQAQARRVAKLNGGGGKKGTPPKPPPRLDAAKEAELRQAFELFDSDKSGNIDANELGDVMKSLGVTLDATELANMMAQMDASGDGQVSFVEFCAVMGSEGEEQSADAIGKAIFKLVDKDGSGKITHSELRTTLLSLGTGLTDDDITAALELFDTGNDGSITLHEFVQVLELMKTFE